MTDFRRIRFDTVLTNARQRRVWTQTKRSLRVLCQTRLPVEFQVGHFADEGFGEWEGRETKHIIRIAARCFRDGGDDELYYAREVAAHEWAHALTHEGGHARESNDHTRLWGLLYADAYRAVFDAHER